MRIALALCILFVSVQSHCQVLKFTSTKVIKIRTASADVSMEDRNASISIDVKGKKISILDGSFKEYIITKADTTSLSKEAGSWVTFHCEDKSGAKAYVLFSPYPKAIQGTLGVAGTLAFTLRGDQYTYSYELQSK